MAALNSCRIVRQRYAPAFERVERQTRPGVWAATVCRAWRWYNHQAARPGQVGGSHLVREADRKKGRVLEEYRLEAQFRCQGSDAFVNWVENTLGIRETATPIWDQR